MKYIRKFMGAAGQALGLGLLAGAFCWPAQALEVQGVRLEDTTTVAGAKLQLNGAGWRKRSYFKTDVTGIYLPERRTTFEGVVNQAGPKRIQIHVLRDIPGSTISRYFISDFKVATTDAEFKQLISDIGRVGQVYSNLHKVSKGDVINLDWIPGKGMSTSINGRLMTIEGLTHVDTPLLYEVFLRMRMQKGPSVPEELRLNLLGLSRSMSGDGEGDN